MVRSWLAFPFIVLANFLFSASGLADPGEVGWRAGVNYEQVGKELARPSGSHEVIEFFWYGCPHCNALEPYFAAWKRTLPNNVVVRRVPAVWRPGVRAHARLFYTLDVLGRGDLDRDVFAVIHTQHNPLAVDGDEAKTFQLQLKFATEHHISAAAFTGAYRSAAVQKRLKQAEELAERYRIAEVPMIVVDGRYVTDVAMAGGSRRIFELVDYLLGMGGRTSDAKHDTLAEK